MQEIINFIVANSVFLLAIWLFLKPRLEHYIDKKIEFGVSTKLEEHKHRLQKDIEIYRSELQSRQPFRDEYIEKNKELIEHLSEINSAIYDLPRAQKHQGDKIQEAFDRYFSYTQRLDDFFIRNRSPYFYKYEQPFQEISNLINDMIRTLNQANASEEKTCTLNLDAILQSIDALKMKIHADTLSLSDE